MPAQLYRGMGVTLLASATQTSSSNSGTLTGTSVFPAGSAISMFLSVTGNVGDRAGLDGVDVYLDTSPDNGTTWFQVEKFAKVTTSTASSMINFRSTGLGGVEAAAFNWTVTGSSASQVANAVLSATNRIRWTLGNNTNTTVTHSAIFAVLANVQPMGSTVV